MDRIGKLWGQSTTTNRQYFVIILQHSSLSTWCSVFWRQKATDNIFKLPRIEKYSVSLLTNNLDGSDLDQIHPFKRDPVQNGSIRVRIADPKVYGPTRSNVNAGSNEGVCAPNLKGTQKSKNLPENHGQNKSSIDVMSNHTLSGNLFLRVMNDRT